MLWLLRTRSIRKKLNEKWYRCISQPFSFDDLLLLIIQADFQDVLETVRMINLNKVCREPVAPAQLLNDWEEVLREEYGRLVQGQTSFRQLVDFVLDIPDSLAFLIIVRD
jgi:hypothetical protein